MSTLYFFSVVGYEIEMFLVNREDRNRRNESSSAAVLPIFLIVTAIGLALAPSASSVGLVRTAAAELPAMHVAHNFLTPDRIRTGPLVGENATSAAASNDTGAIDNNNNNSTASNSTGVSSTDNSWCYNQGIVTEADGSMRQITSCWNSQQECQDMQMVDQEASGKCFQNPNAQPDQSTHNSWCYNAGPDPVEDQSCWDSQQQCEQVQMADAQATSECSKVTPSAPQG